MRYLIPLVLGLIIGVQQIAIWEISGKEKSCYEIGREKAFGHDEILGARTSDYAPEKKYVDWDNLKVPSYCR